MYWVIGILTLIGIIVGIFTILKKDRKLGILQLMLTFIVPLSIFWFCSRKSHFVFGGSDFEFLIQCAIVDQRIEPWIIFFLVLVCMLLIVINIIRITRLNRK
ncbi:MAG TPA: hypothetical protein IAD49_02850 [Candidatus Fimihabitans intestinipullorum]|uniref:Uncharacterized protein n=1 Tax=Candidatus Fimihabitans intestinipullorum TaxID=2840820 RepID=A0A9D1HUF6_9BACT|nr:hypothetical protein [Candidatus Fimihabitans intestinipullorum]